LKPAPVILFNIIGVALLYNLNSIGQLHLPFLRNDVVSNKILLPTCCSYGTKNI